MSVQCKPFLTGTKGQAEQEQAVRHLYDEAVKLGLLAHPYVRAQFVSLYRTFDVDMYQNLRERVERAWRTNALKPDTFQAFRPMREEARGEIPLGFVAGTTTEYGLSSTERHWLVLGATGYGKSTITRKALKAFLEAGKRCFVFSKKKDARSIATLYADRVVLFRLADHDFSINPKEGSPGINLVQSNTNFCEAFCQAEGLLLGSSNYLLANIAELDEKFGTRVDVKRQASLFELREHIGLKKHVSFARDARFQESILNRLDGLLLTHGPLFACSQGFSIERALNDGYSVILETDGVSEDVALFLTTSITLRLFTWMLHSRENTPSELCIFLDDSQELWNINLERRDEMGLPIMGLMAARFRTAGTIVATTQVPNLTSIMLRQNCATKLILNQNNHDDALCTARLVGLPDRQAGELMRLKVGEAVCFKPSYPYPVKVRIPLDPSIDE